MLIYSTFFWTISSIHHYVFLDWDLVRFSFMVNDSPIILSTDISSFSHCGHILSQEMGFDSPLLFFRPLFNISYSLKPTKRPSSCPISFQVILPQSLHMLASFLQLQISSLPQESYGIATKNRWHSQRVHDSLKFFLTIFHILFLQFTNNENH